ncbi:MAG: T9SS type A sorting domain-containing protein [Saprospiraceae bacterium]|nr:T9SS type A sorting domain-containing protein [Saprospiraceae bacterium]
MARIPIDVTQCDELTVCNSYFENSNAPTGLVPLISVNNATSFDIFQNIFEKINSDFGAINIINSPTGIIRNNYFDDNKIGIKVSTDALGAGFECNFHENSETAWKVDNNTQLGPQGILNIPARNKFLSSNNLDIENQDQFEFNYYYEDLNADRPTLMTAPEVNLIEATPIPDIICFTQSEIIDEWLQWETCVDIRDAIDLDNLICPHTGCTYHVPPPPSRTLDEIQQQQGGGQRIENQNLFNEKFGFISKEEITNNGAFRMSPNPVNDIIEITINPEYMDAHFIIYNTVGKKMLDGRLDSRINKISVDQLPSGIYNISILFSDGKPNVHQFIKM